MRTLWLFSQHVPSTSPLPKKMAIEIGSVHGRGCWSLSAGRGLTDSVTTGTGHGERGLGNLVCPWKSRVRLMSTSCLESSEAVRLSEANHRGRELGEGTASGPIHHDV